MFRNIFTWMETERKLMFLLFVLIISIAVITVVGMLTMIVMEKRKAIGILKSMGASRAGIMGIFIIHGTTIGILGALLGSALGWLGCGVIVDPAAIVGTRQEDGNQLVIARTPAGAPAAWYAGSGWDRSGRFPDAAAWDRYLKAFAARLRSPLQVEVAR